MPTRKEPTLLARGKPRTLGGSTPPWRARLYAPAGDGEPWKRVLRRAASEEEAARSSPRQRLTRLRAGDARRR